VKKRKFEKRKFSPLDVTKLLAKYGSSQKKDIQKISRIISEIK
jgi:hypothetical protein